MHINRSIFDIRRFCMSDKMYSGSDIIMAMYDHTDEEGIIAVKNYRPEDPVMIPIGESEYRVDWGSCKTKARNLFNRMVEFDDFLNTLRQASVLANANVPCDPDQSRDHSAALRCFANTFLRPIPLPFSDYGTESRFPQMTEHFLESVNREAERNVGSGPMAYDLQVHCLRYCRLLSIGVPYFVLESEEQRLALAYIIHYYSKPVRVCDVRIGE